MRPSELADWAGEGSGIWVSWVSFLCEVTKRVSALNDWALEGIQGLSGGTLQALPDVISHSYFHFTHLSSTLSCSLCFVGSLISLLVLITWIGTNVGEGEKPSRTGLGVQCWVPGTCLSVGFAGLLCTGVELQMKLSCFSA